MPLQMGTASEGSIGANVANAVYGKTGTITKVEQKLDAELGNYHPDLFLTVEVDAGGKYPDTIDIFGSFSRDEVSREVIDWGSCFVIDRFIKRCGGYDGLSEDEMQLTDNNTIPATVLDNLVGKKIAYLLYCAGKNRNKDKPVFSTYPSAYRINEDDDVDDLFASLYDEMCKNDYHYGRLQKGRDYLDQNQRQTGGSQGPAPRQDDGGSAPTPADDDLPF